MCNDDVYFLTNIVSLVWEYNKFNPDIDRNKLQNDTLTLLKELFENGMIRVFQITSEKCSDISHWDIEKILLFIREEWDKTGKLIPDENEVAWFETTKKGELAANEITDFRP
jgi:hypothetical protein